METGTSGRERAEVSCCCGLGLRSLSGVGSSLLQLLLVQHEHTLGPLEPIVWRRWLRWVHDWPDHTVTAVGSMRGSLV